ncbi:MAG: hypothetical protein KGY61_09775 [Desulfobacterales bacterium]|nr:hypothetical protein [Desulfobacterales bacterium]
MKKWQCTVCGYIHTGEAPPEKCPVCGADKDKFVEIKEETSPETGNAAKADEQKPTGAAAEGAASTTKPDAMEFIRIQMIKHHVHPVSVHIPNGVIPMAVLFVFLAVIFQFPSLATTAFYSMVFVLLTMPLVLYSGYNEWQRKYRANPSSIFIAKIASALIVSAASLIIVLWHLLDPDIASASSMLRPVYLFIHLIMLGAAFIAGFIGGKLVFKD